MTEDATRAAESMVEQQVMEAYQMVTHILNEQPISTVLEAFWDILLAKPHRYTCYTTCYHLSMAAPWLHHGSQLAEPMFMLLSSQLTQYSNTLTIVFYSCASHVSLPWKCSCAGQGVFMYT